jgi:hypothetical protein
MKQVFLCLAIFFAFSIFENQLIAQPSLSPYNLHPPLAGDLLLSGSFGEVRTNSFHAGIDFRTGGKVGLRVFASEKGYVSRIRVSAVGFGKAIYIQHPNGLTTVYAHLDQFAPKIEEFVKTHQYKNRSFEVDLYLTPNDFRIERAEFIALSGNTGSSGGPHLHFEVRQTANQIPLNPAFSNLQIRDTLPPVINSAWIYSLNSNVNVDLTNRTELNVQSRRGKYIVSDTVRVTGTVGVGVKAYDYINKNSLRCGVYAIKMFVNNRLHYHYSADEFSFAETRFANSHIDYALRQTDGKRVHRLFKDPNNLFSGYKSILNNGYINAKKDSIYRVQLIVEDAYSNKSELNIVLKGVEKNMEIVIPDSNQVFLDNRTWLFYNDNNIKTDLFSISMPKNSLYHNIEFTYDIIDKQPKMYSPIIKIHNNLIPIHRPYELAINANGVPENLLNKSLIGTFGKNNTHIAVGGNYSNGSVVANINYFGDFFILVDTVAPTITPLNIFNKKNMSKESSIRLKVEDDLSGVSKINGFINGQWALFEYDPKNSLIFYKFDNLRLKKGNTNNLLVEVIDNKGNKNEYKCSFEW